MKIYSSFMDENIQLVNEFQMKIFKIVKIHT